MGGIKNLAKETAIYGVSSIVGKFLNWCLVPLYTYVLSSSAEYGVVTNLYAWTALLLIALTYGMETGLFRFLGREDTHPMQVYSTTLITLFTTSTLFAVVCSLCSAPIARCMGYADHPEYISMLAIVVSMDAFDSIPFAYLRYVKRPIRFASLKLLMIGVNIVMNLFFLLLCPYLMQHYPSTVDWFYQPDYGVGYVFVANFISTTAVTLALLPDIFVGQFYFDRKLLKEMLHYSLPLLVLGIVGIMNQTVDKILFPFLLEDRAVANAQLGIYGACFKVSMVMMMFSQAFRYAYEPFIFARNKDAHSREAYADSMKFYIISSLLIFLGMIAFLDLLKYLIREDYWEGMRIIPIVLVAYIFQGIYFNLSLWYKLTDQTHYGAYMSFLGLVLNLSLILVLVPLIGYMGLAVSSLCAFLLMMCISYVWGQRVFHVPYDLKSIAVYATLAVVLYGGMVAVKCYVVSVAGRYLLNILLLGIFVTYMIHKDMPLSDFLRRKTCSTRSM